jgi:hypothetical protein
MILAAEDGTSRTKTGPIASFFTTNPTYTGLDLNPGLRGERLVSNRLFPIGSKSDLHSEGRGSTSYSPAVPQTNRTNNVTARQTFFVAKCAFDIRNSVLIVAVECDLIPWCYGVRCGLMGGWMDGLILGSSPYGPVASRPYRPALCAP